MIKVDILLIFTILGVRMVSGFAPPVRTVRTMTPVQEALQATTSSGGEKKPSFLAKAANKFTSLLPGSKVKSKSKEDLQLIKRGEIERRNQRNDLAREMKEGLRPFPWPIRAFGNTITNTVTRTLGKENRKAEVLLRDAQNIIHRDRDVVAALGDPIYVGQLFSQRSSSKMINRVKSEQIMLAFEVIGSKQTGTGSLVADKYAKGHIVALRVRVGGISYDIDL